MLTAEIMLGVTRLAGRRTTGVCPLGAQERPIGSWLEMPVSSPQPAGRPGTTVSSPQQIMARWDLARLAMAG